MKFKVFILLFLIISCAKVDAQLERQFEHTAEYGVSVGLGHYFGDLNVNGAINHPKFAAGVFYLKRLNDYVSYRVNGNYTFLGYSDAYSNNPVQHIRNLSFNSKVWELSVTGNFNFFKFFPELPQYRFTPYINIGLGAMYFDPYTYLNGEKYLLRKIGTEGQSSAAGSTKKQYSPFAAVVPLGFGVKYNITDEINLFGELTYRFTTTDYLDDVSGNYAGLDAFANNPIAQKLQDRSYEYGTPIGIKGRQRGTSNQKDSYATFQVGISFNIQNYRCPTY